MASEVVQLSGVILYNCKTFRNNMIVLSLDRRRKNLLILTENTHTNEWVINETTAPELLLACMDISVILIRITDSSTGTVQAQVTSLFYESIIIMEPELKWYRVNGHFASKPDISKRIFKQRVPGNESPDIHHQSVRTHWPLYLPSDQMTCHTLPLHILKN